MLRRPVLSRALRATSRPLRRSTLIPRYLCTIHNRPSLPYRPLRSPAPSYRPLSTETKQAIQSAISSAPVVLFMKGTPETPQCGFSRASIQILGLQGVDPAKFTAFNVLEDESLRQGIKEFSDWPTIPQLYVGGEFVGGCDILVGMHQSGELAKLLGEKNVLVEAEAEGQQDEAMTGGDGATRHGALVRKGVD